MTLRALELGTIAPSSAPSSTKRLADLNRDTSDLQASVMSIRMIPMSVVYNRFPHMLRDLAAKLGKKVTSSPKAKPPNSTKALPKRSPTR